jgi:hypothetical protein
MNMALYAPQHYDFKRSHSDSATCYRFVPNARVADLDHPCEDQVNETVPDNNCTGESYLEAQLAHECVLRFLREWAAQSNISIDFDKKWTDATYECVNALDIGADEWIPYVE